MKRKSPLFGLFLILVISLVSLNGCGFDLTPDQADSKPIVLNYWRPWDGRESFDEIIKNYQAIHPYVKINYKKLNYDEFEKELIEAFATDRGPEIYSIHNTWTRKYKEKGFIAPMPSSVTMEYHIMKGAIKKELYIEERTSKTMTLKELENNFVDVVYDDVVISDKDSKTDVVSENIYALPLFVDTLAMFYNKDLFNNAGIVTPPKYWDKEFQQDVKKITKQNNRGEIVQSGVALGGSDNIYRASDILSLLMMQNGTEMMNNSGDVLFNRVPSQLAEKGKKTAPGMDALRFYSDFSNIAKEVYCWNNELNNSLDLFTEGKIGMMFGYSFMIPQIKAKNEKLTFGISAMPQIEGNSQINFANYWVEVVSKKIKDKRTLDAAWDFLQFITKAEQAEIYLNSTQKPTALKSLIDKQVDNQELGVFAEQVLTAKSWYRGIDSDAAEAVMNDMIDESMDYENDIQSVINLGASKVQQTSSLK